MANTNIINAVFGSGICAVTTSAFRANYGVVLRFSGIDLPTAFECDFSNYDTSNNDSITAIGQDGEVQIPDQLWDSGLNIYAYVYLHPTDDSGVTVYTVTIPVLGRPNRTEETPTPHEQTVIEQAISALNDAVEQTAADVETTTANAQAAAQSEANASVSERSAAASASAALASQNAAESAAQSATESASGAAESARNAANSAAQAAQSATDAQEYAEQAEQSAQSIEGDVERAERAAQTASDKATEASASATAAAQSASSASTAAQNAASSASSAESHATDAETAKQAAQDAQAAAEQASEDSEAAAVRAEQAEQEVLSAMDGTYENLTSGNAQQLLSTVTESNSVPYLFRPTAANADRAYLDEVVGGTVAWNQLLIDPSNFANNTDTAKWRPYNRSNGSLSFASDELTYTVTTVGNTVWGNGIKCPDFYKTQGHVLLLSYKIYVPKPCEVTKSYFQGYVLADAVAGWNDIATIQKTLTSGNSYNIFGVSNLTDAGYVVGDTYKIKYPIIIDLTLLFGSTIADYIYNLETASAGAGVAYFRKLFPNDYYEYNSGELLSVEGVSAKRTVGFNLFDESVLNSLVGVSKIGNYWVGTVGNFIRSENTGIITSSVRLIEGVSYCVSAHGILASGGTTNFRVKVAYTDGTYDQSLANFIDAGQEGTAWLITDASKKISSVGFTYGTGGTASRFSLEWFCINLSDPVRNGTYEPYTERTYPLDSSLTLRGVPKLDASGNLYYDGDTYAPDGTVTRRYGVVDLGTLTWAINTQYVNPVFLASIPLAKLPLTSSLLANATCAIYEQKAATNTNVAGVNKVFAIGKYYTLDYELNVIDTSYTSASDFKTAMSGVYLVYELATPTTETATPYRHLQICDPNGTEEFVSTGIVPVGHNTRYPENLRAKIEGLPWNFNSIIAMTETTTTASKAYSVGDYFILNNVLYRVTSAIASGGTITIGTNCRATTIMDEIKALS